MLSCLPSTVPAGSMPAGESTLRPSTTSLPSTEAATATARGGVARRAADVVDVAGVAGRGDDDGADCGERRSAATESASCGEPKSLPSDMLTTSRWSDEVAVAVRVDGQVDGLGRRRSVLPSQPKTRKA